MEALEPAVSVVGIVGHARDAASVDRPRMLVSAFRVSRRPPDRCVPLGRARSRLIGRPRRAAATREAQVGRPTARKIAPFGDRAPWASNLRVGGSKPSRRATFFLMITSKSSFGENFASEFDANLTPVFACPAGTNSLKEALKHYTALTGHTEHRIPFITLFRVNMACFPSTEVGQPSGLI